MLLWKRFLITLALLLITIYGVSAVEKDAQATPTSNTVREVSFEQQTNQTFSDAVSQSDLTAKEKQIISQLPIISNTQFKRKFHLIFVKEAASNDLLGLSEIQVQSENTLIVFDASLDDDGYVTFVSNISKREALLNNDASSSKPETSSKATVESVSKVEPEKKETSTDKQVVDETTKKPAATNKPAVNEKEKVVAAKKPAAKAVVNSKRHDLFIEKVLDDAVYMRFSHKKGSILEDTIKQLPLTSLQKRLITRTPVRRSAVSDRYFHLYFERDKAENAKYLRAITVTRDDQRADFVLVKQGGQWDFADENGNLEGQNDFARYPLRFKRISSRFNYNRKHPVLRKARPHTGVDFVADSGTPVTAPYAGTVTFSGRMSGYGRIVMIEHKEGYETRYAHLLRISNKAKKGATVNKGDVIGYVGRSGLATGNHLHYEVRVNGTPRDPLTVKLPSGGKRTTEESRARAKNYLPKLNRLLDLNP